jgi:hypothetical protein
VVPYGLSHATDLVEMRIRAEGVLSAYSIGVIVYLKGRTAKRAGGVVLITTLLSLNATASLANPQDRDPLEGSGGDGSAVEIDPREIAAEFTGEGAAVNDQVVLPDRGTQDIEIHSESGLPPVKVGLPENLQPTPSESDGAEAVSFEASDGSFDMTTESMEAGARALLTIRNAEAPTEYPFEIDSDAEITLVPVPSGGVEIVDEYNEAIAYVEAPWALDANGEKVPTSFRVEGRTIIQVVEHSGAAYPIVADPAVQHDCGWVTCTIRFDRGTTHSIAYSGGPVSTIASGACQYAPGHIKVTCTLVVNGMGWLVSGFARDYYENGNCFGIRYAKPPVYSPHATQVNHGTYNCTGK